MNKWICICALLVIGCKKERLSVFSEAQIAALQLQNGSMELITKLVAIHDCMNRGGSGFNQGAVVRTADTIGTVIYDTLRFYKKENNPYVHSIVAGFSTSIRDTLNDPTGFTIKLTDLSWNDMQFTGEIQYSYSNPTITTIQLNGMHVVYRNNSHALSGMFLANKSNTDHFYTGWLTALGTYGFEWNTDNAYTMNGDFTFSSINTIPSGLVFCWREGASKLRVEGTELRQIMDQNFYQYNKIMVLDDQDSRRIMEFPQF